MKGNSEKLFEQKVFKIQSLIISYEEQGADPSNEGPRGANRLSSIDV